jgi:hypothetical protein
MRYSMLKAFRGLRLQKRMKVKKDWKATIDWTIVVKFKNI